MQSPLHVRFTESPIDELVVGLPQPFQIQKHDAGVAVDGGFHELGAHGEVCRVRARAEVLPSNIAQERDVGVRV